MTSDAAHPEARIAVFAKAPVPGEVKTRLAAAIGAERAATLHAGLVRRALSTAIGARVGRVALWCAPDASHPFFARCAQEFGVDLEAQEGADLGERMRGAFGAAFAAGKKLVIIGSDCPALGAHDLREAVEALRTEDAVLAPADDGGYALIGLARPLPTLFDGIAWGDADVMERTRAKLAAASARWTELRTLWDVDRPEDFARLQREGLLPELLA